MAEVTVTDPDEHESGKKVDDRGRVYVGTEYAGEYVRIIVEREGQRGEPSDA